VVKRALQEGLLDKAAYQRTLDDLPDLSHRVQTSDDPAPAPSAVTAPSHEAAPSGNGAGSPGGTGSATTSSANSF
jgi:hypothetical protein